MTQTGTFSEAFIKMAELNAIVNAAEEGDYTRDGLLYCGRCNTPKQANIKLQAASFMVFIPCKCKEEANEKQRAFERKQEYLRYISDLRRDGIADVTARGYTFAADDGSNPKMRQVCERYVSQWEAVKEKSIGMLFYGGVGTGKSFYAYCIANALIDKGVSVLVTSLPKLISADNPVLDIIADFELLVIDDLGAERNTSFAVEKTFEAIDTRIKSKKPIIITTNLAPTDFMTEEIQYKRIYDRILGACAKVKFTGNSMRRKTHTQKEIDAKELLGL